MCRIWILCLLIQLWWPGQVLARAEDPEELERSWQAAWIFLPDSGPEGYRRLSAQDLPEVLANLEEPLPVVVYAHGCAGHYQATTVTGSFLAKAGFLVVGPDSFARRDKPVSCVPARTLGGLHRGVLAWRHAEVRYAIDKLQSLPSIREDAVFLMGFSEGGITTATFKGSPLAGRVIEGWTCHAGWPEYRGLRAPDNEPILALVAANDPWFRLPILRGDCGAFMAGRPDATSLVVEAPPMLAASHWLSKDPEIQGQIVGFLADHMP